MSADLVQDYFDRIGRVRLLTRDEERELARQVEVGVLARERLETRPRRRAAELRYLVKEGEAALRRLVESNLRLVVSLARRYQGRGVSLADLIQDGNAGLIRAVYGFDFAKGYRFSTYATFWIRDAIDQGIVRQAHEIRIPHYQLRRLASVRKRYHELALLGGPEPTLEEVADVSHIPVDEVRDLLRLGHTMVSLSESVGEHESTLADVLPSAPESDPAQLWLVRERSAAIASAVDALTPDEQRVIEAEFGVRASSTPAAMARSRPRALPRDLPAILEALRHDPHLRVGWDRGGLANSGAEPWAQFAVS